MGLGTLIAGPIGGAFGYALHDFASKEIGSLRRTKSNNFKDHAEDADEEVDWVVDSLVRNTEDHFKALDEETRAYAERREHLPRGATMSPEEEAEEERKRTLLHFDSRTSRLNVAGWDIKFGNSERVEEGDEDEALKEENAPEETSPIPLRATGTTARPRSRGGPQGNSHRRGQPRGGSLWRHAQGWRRAGE